MTWGDEDFDLHTVLQSQLLGRLINALSTSRTQYKSTPWFYLNAFVYSFFFFFFFCCSSLVVVVGLQLGVHGVTEESVARERVPALYSVCLGVKGNQSDPFCPYLGSTCRTSEPMRRLPSLWPIRIILPLFGQHVMGVRTNRTPAENTI